MQIKEAQHCSLLFAQDRMMSFRKAYARFLRPWNFIEFGSWKQIQSVAQALPSIIPPLRQKRALLCKVMCVQKVLHDKPDVLSLFDLS